MPPSCRRRRADDSALAARQLPLAASPPRARARPRTIALMQRESSSPPSRWLWILLVWGGMGLFDAVQTVVVMRAVGMHHDWVALFFKLLLGWLPWALATPAIMRVGARHPLAAAR